MSEPTIEICLPDGRTVTVLCTRSSVRPPRWRFVYAPGAGSGLNDGFGVFASRMLAERGIDCVRFQFPYAEAGRRRPDPPAVLAATWETVIATVRGDAAKLVVGGRSMGGRIASVVVAGGAVVDALALFAYPLHPPGHADRPRDGHLPRIQVPTLFCSGTNDAFGTPAELRAAAAKVPRSVLHLMDGADHRFHVPKRTGRTQEDVWTEAVEAFSAWLDSSDVSARQ